MTQMIGNYIVKICCSLKNVKKTGPSRE